MNPNVNMIREYVEAVADATDPVIDWTIYPDHAGCREVARDLRGTLDNVWPELEAANLAGAAIAMRLAEFDGNGTHSKDVLAVRAVLQDSDFGRLPVESDPPQSAHVLGRGGDHRVWFLAGTEAKRFLSYPTVATALAVRDGTDPAVNLLTQVQRLPGSVNWKNPSAPFLVELLECHADRRYTLKELLNAAPSPLEDVVDSYRSWHTAKKLTLKVGGAAVPDFGTS